MSSRPGLPRIKPSRRRPGAGWRYPARVWRTVPRDEALKAVFQTRRRNSSGPEAAESPSSHLGRAGTMSAEPANGPTEDQVEILEYNFNKVNRHPDPTTLCLIAAEAGLSEEETQKWFKQRLAQWRRSEGLPSECRSVTD